LINTAGPWELCKFTIHVITSVRDAESYTNVETTAAKSHSKMVNALLAICVLVVSLPHMQNDLEISFATECPLIAAGNPA